MARRSESAGYRHIICRQWCDSLLVATLALLLLTPAGCRTANYSANTLPQPLRVSADHSNNVINLSGIARRGASTSQIATGDLLEVTIASGIDEEASKPVKLRVSADGTILVPLVGQVSVAGLEPSQAEQRVASMAIERGVYRQPYITVTVDEQAVNRVTVLGAVTEPGVYELPRGASDLSNALGAAGGFSEEAGTEVEILHQGPPSFLASDQSPAASSPASGVALASYEDRAAPAGPLGFSPPRLVDQQTGRLMSPSSQRPSPANTVRIDLAKAAEANATNCELGDRDVVMVLPKEKQFIHVTGLVNKADEFEIPRDQTIRLLDAVAMAGGTSSPVADRVYVIRQMDGMPQPAVIEVSLSKAKRDGEENLVLAAGDLVSVENTLTTALVDTARTFFRVAVGFSGNLATF